MIATALIAAVLVAAEDPKPNDRTLGMKPPGGAVVLLAMDATAPGMWTDRAGKPAGWKVDGGVMTVGRGDVKTTEAFGSFRLHVEFQTPSMPDARGQARGNSGVYLDGSYELQVLDSFGLTPQTNDCGAIYQQVAPSVNACKPPLQWQTYDVTFTKAKVEGGKVAAKARVTVVHNGIETIADREISPSPGGLGLGEGEPGPILLQDHGNDVKYRNIWIEPKG